MRLNVSHHLSHLLTKYNYVLKIGVRYRRGLFICTFINHEIKRSFSFFLGKKPACQMEECYCSRTTLPDSGS